MMGQDVIGTRGGSVVVRCAGVIAANLIGFAILNRWFRALEARGAVLMLRPIASTSHVRVVNGVSILLIPHHGKGAFTAIITPSCSALAAVLAIGCLSWLTPRQARHRRLIATTLAIGVIMVGNVARIAASSGVGLYEGRASLVLFHDWVGGLMTFAYTLGGYVLMLLVLLPDRRRAPAPDAPEATLAPTR